MSRLSGWQAVDRALSAIHAIADEITVPVVANLNTKKLDDDYAEFFSSTEFLSENEASQILIGLQENQFYTKFFGDELEFIEAVLNGDFAKIPRARKIVFSTAQSGTGAGQNRLYQLFVHADEFQYAILMRT